MLESFCNHRGPCVAVNGNISTSSSSGSNSSSCCSSGSISSIGSSICVGVFFRFGKSVGVVVEEEFLSIFARTDLAFGRFRIRIRYIFRAFNYGSRCRVAPHTPVRKAFVLLTPSISHLYPISIRHFARM